MCLLETNRLILRTLGPKDIQSVTAWLSDYDVTRMTSRVPHPYVEDYAEAFVAAGEHHLFVITRKADGVFIGLTGLHAGDDYEFDYWLGKPFWGFGYATKAAYRLVT